MQVGGKRQGDDIAASSDFVQHPECQPCGLVGKHSVAEGYCQNCCEYLCLQCFTTHTKPKPLRHHILLDKSNMPDLTASHRGPKPSMCTIHCLDHSIKLREFYCPSHDISVCSVCVTLAHATCGVKYIPDLPNVNNYKQSAEYKQLIADIERLQTNTDTAINDVNKTKKAIVAGIKMVVKKMQNELKITVQNYKDSEKELLAIIKRFEEEDDAGVLACYNDLVSLQLTIDDAKTTLQSLEQEGTNLYSESKRVNKLILDFQDQLEGYVDRIKVPEYSFSPDQRLHLCLQSTGGLGTLTRSYKTKPLSFKLPDIDTKSANDKRDAWITGLVYRHPHTLLTVDNFNNVLKSIDTSTGTLTSELTLPGSPHDITLLPKDMGAITLPKQKQVLLISTKGKPTCSRCLPVSGYCRGIASILPNIAVSFHNPMKVEIMDLKGKVLTSVTTDNPRKDLFVYSVYMYLTASRESSGDIIFVSDTMLNTILKITAEGKVVGSYKQPNWRRLLGVTCVGENLLVCDCNGETVELMNKDGERMSTLLCQNHGIKEPQAVCYSDEEAKLYVSSNCVGRPISVFRLKNM